MSKKSFDSIKVTVCRAEGLVELVFFTLLYYIIWRGGYAPEVFPSFFGYGKWVLMGVYAFLVFILFHFNEGFKFGYLKVSDLISSQWVSLLIVNFITYFQLCLIANKIVNAVPVLGLTFTEMLIAFVFILTVTKIYSSMAKPEKMLMICGSDKPETLKLKMDSRSDKYQIADVVSADIGLERLIEHIVKYDSVVINDVSAEMRNDIVKFCYMNEIRTYLTPKISDVIIKGTDNIHLFDSPLMLVKIGGLTLSQRFFKRAMDIILCSIALIVLFPFMLILALAIKLEDGGPVFYKQKRVTRNNREFYILKLRSMVVDAEKSGQAVLAEKDDPRITKVGRFVRAIRADEIPQILNILKGDMSIVGPRPERMELIEKITEEIPEFAFRTKVKGGLTGYAQVFGKYNTTFYDKLMLDMMYIENYSLILDIKIIIMTVKILFKKESTEGVDSREKSGQSNESAAAEGEKQKDVSQYNNAGI